VALRVRVKDGVQLSVKLVVPVICGVPVTVGDSEHVCVVEGVIDLEAVCNQLRDMLRECVRDWVSVGEKVRQLGLALEQEGLSVVVVEWVALGEGVYDNVLVVVARAVGVELALGVLLCDLVPDADPVLVG